MINGLSYGCVTGSIAYPLRNRSKDVFNSGMASVVLELVHPDNLGALPPNPNRIASLGDMMGLASYSEFWNRIWY